MQLRLFQMSLNFKVRTVQVILHLLSFYGFYKIIFLFLSFYWLLLSLVVYWVTGTLGINVGMHRLLAHKSFTTGKYRRNFLTWISVTTAVGSPLAWCGLHRWHHANTDTEKDPHSPLQIGSFRAWFGLWNKVKIPPSYVVDFMQDPTQRFVHIHYFKIIFIYGFTLLLLGPNFLIFGFAIPASLCLHATSAISVIAHKWGYRNHETKDHSKNSFLAAVITLGEGWHNNHHNNTNAWNNKENWWELDLPAFLIRHFFKKKTS